MEKKTKNTLINLVIIIVIVAIAWYVFTRNNENVDEKTAKCIGENSIIYIQKGCHACEIQEQMFGENYQYLTIVDCLIEREKCAEAGIEATPTWVINNQKVEAVQTIENLKYYTGC